MKSMTKEYIVISVLFIVELFWLNGIAEMTTSPSRNNGNGNVAYLFWPPFILLGLYLCIHIYLFYLRTIDWTLKNAVRLLIISAIINSISIVAEIVWVRHMLRSLDAMQQVSAEHTNTIYLNVWTLLIALGLSSMMAGFRLWRKSRSVRKINNYN
ncbi:hypothetical protein QCD85_04870 [Paenibacillus sp. PsM32]|uniref:hypothetical protein n=1 Tax=Paenibacillus sp. PsM32 TaxID=3030536 RepID=UPI00263B2750|nr:hypothetical protein [Paenibacillus sp. PsM32]MDN4617416.1 hypothetical protein [Paenibacillus sp. PsM32]